MISNVDKLLLTSAQQAEILRMKERYLAAEKAGDLAGMEAAHQRAEEIRASAGYSGGEGGDQYLLLQSDAPKPSGYQGYEELMKNYLGSSMNAISAGYQQRAAELEREREEIAAREDEDQAAARSAAWSVQRLAQDGLLNRGLSSSGIADAITASALNQASANAYQALLDRRAALRENDTAKAENYAGAMEAAAQVQSDFAEMLGDAYGDFYQFEADAELKLLLEKLKGQLALQEGEADFSHQLALQKAKEQSALAQAEKEYYYQLALQKLKLGR